MPLLAISVNDFWKRSCRNKGEELCKSALYQARRPIFYAHWGVPDTLEGRFDLACLHVALILRYIKGSLAQAVFDAYFAYTEMTLREIGVSDLRVGGQVKKCATFFYGAMKAYDEALDQKGDLEKALLRNLYGNEPHISLSKLANYVRTCSVLLEEQDLENSKKLIWPNIE